MFMDFVEEVRVECLSIGDVEEGDGMREKTIDSLSNLKECWIKVSIWSSGKVISGRIGQLSVDFNKVIILIEDLIGTALACRKDKDVGIEPNGVMGLMLKRD